MVDLPAPYLAALAALAAYLSPSQSLLLMGAFARDLCLPLRCRRARRKTDDVDVVVWVSDWSELDRLLETLSQEFEVNARDLRLIHHTSRAKIDLAPCGDIEAPPGVLQLRGAQRTLRLLGLRAAFHQACMALLPGGHSLRIPPPALFVLLKLQAYLDRRESRDLRDAGFVLLAVDANGFDAWSDAALMEHFAEERLTYEDVPQWCMGVRLRESLSAAELPQAVAILEQIQSLDEVRRIELARAERSYSRESEEELKQADGCSGSFERRFLPQIRSERARNSW